MAESGTGTTASPVKAKKVWTTLITNARYLPGLLTLDYSLKKSGTKRPLVALYTDSFPESGRASLDAHGIPKQKIEYLLPKVSKEYKDDPRFHDTWSKLAAFSLTQYDRVVQLDSDMLVLRNIDELMDLELDPPSAKGKGERVFAASHACVCNPLKKQHYPKDWIPENCAFTMQHNDPDLAQTHGAPSSTGLGLLNSGLLVINPSQAVYDIILTQLDTEATLTYDFPDQALLADMFSGSWVALPYTYNALKTMRTADVHDRIWRDEEVKNIHYILSPKPWDDEAGRSSSNPTHQWWWKLNGERVESEKQNDIQDV